MNLSLIRSMTRSAVFELENGLCYRPAHPFTVTLNGKTVYEACQTNVFSLFSLLPGTEYTVGVQAEGESLTCTFTTEAETFFVDASRYGLVADGTTDNTLKLQAALSTCPKGGTVYVPAGRYRTCQPAQRNTHAHAALQNGYLQGLAAKGQHSVFSAAMRCLPPCHRSARMSATGRTSCSIPAT